MATEAPPTPAIPLTAAELRELREMVERALGAVQDAHLFVRDWPARRPYWRAREAFLAPLLAKLRAAEARVGGQTR